MKKSILLLILFLFPLSSFAQDTINITNNQSPNTVTYSKPINNSIVLDLISQLDGTLFIRNYHGSSLYENWKYESAPYLKTHSYLNSLFLEQIQSSVNEDTFYSENFQTKIHLNVLRAFATKDKMRLKVLMMGVSKCYKKNIVNVSKYTDEKTFLNTECTSEMNIVDNFLLLKIQNRLKVVPLIPTK